MDKVYLLQLTHSITLQKLAIPYHVQDTYCKYLLNKVFLLKIPVSVVLPKENFENEICVIGEVETIKPECHNAFSITIVGKKKVRLTNKLSREGAHLLYQYEEITEDKTLRNAELFDVKILKDFILSRFKDSLNCLGNFKKIEEALKDPEVAINYATFFLLDSMVKKEEIMKARSLSEKIELLYEALSPNFSEIIKFK